MEAAGPSAGGGILVPPLIWAAYVLLCRDIELACDERVVRDMNRAQRAAYSQALLDCAMPRRRRLVLCPLAFGEVGSGTG